MSKLAVYFNARTEREKAYAEYNYAGARFDLSQIKERLAEVDSQCIESVGEGKLFEVVGQFTDRERMIVMAVARYVVLGRGER
jgi:hypothetical protein